MKKSFRVIHAIAICKDCGWRNEQYKNAQATAAIHARKYEHKVHVEAGLTGIYDGRRN